MNHLDLLIFLIPLGLAISAAYAAKRLDTPCPPEGESQPLAVEEVYVYLKAS